MPRFSVMLVNFFRPGILRTVMSSLPLRYSIGDDLDFEAGRLGEGALHRRAVVADAGDGDLEVVAAVRIVSNDGGMAPAP